MGDYTNSDHYYTDMYRQLLSFPTFSSVKIHLRVKRESGFSPHGTKHKHEDGTSMMFTAAMLSALTKYIKLQNTWHYIGVKAMQFHVGRLGCITIPLLTIKRNIKVSKKSLSNNE